MGSFEWTNDELFHLGTEGFSSNIRMRFHNLKQLLPERRISEGELESERWEDRLKITPVFDIS